jgi:DNA invertase Pin-like site-specific DNA recombinase
VAADRSRRRRCAIYTRKSSEEGLAQDFNSLDAQREACEAYIRSQAGEGWQLVRTRYDDGGYSGGTLKRPAVVQLLADIQAGKIDTVVVYKVDRLTRSLADFAKIVEVLDAHEVSFVSVTQQFNTTTSMGRLTLNMLLSFSQFEREVTGERIRDKIAASKQKGLWMGGHVPLGYEPDGRTLVIVEAEAETVRTLFRLYLELGTVRRVKEEADRQGLTTKVRPGASRPMRGGRPLSLGHIYYLLSNPLYVGRVPHNGESYEGQHPAIVDPETWDTAQRRLAAQTPARQVQRSTRSRSLLQGKLFDEAGGLLTPSHTVKSGRRYRYYLSRNERPTPTGSVGEGRSQHLRLPAREIERLVEDAVVALFASPGELVQLARESGISQSRVSKLVEHVRGWRGQPLDVVKRVDLRAQEMTVQIDLSPHLGSEGAVVRHVVPVHFRRRGGDVRLVLHGSQEGSSDARADPAFVKAMVRGRKWFDDLASGRASSLVEIAKAEGVTDRYVGHLLPLAFLAPDIVASVLSGTQPVDLTAEALTKRISLPLAWASQRKRLGFD